MARRSYVAVLISAVACYAALGAVLRTLPALTADRALLGLLVGARGAVACAGLSQAMMRGDTTRAS
jgi:hypothetical protein